MSTSRLDEYMQDPDIADEPMPLREVHAIRLMIYDDIKDMSFDERNSYFRKDIDKICKEFNITLVPCRAE